MKHGRQVAFDDISPQSTQQPCAVLVVDIDVIESGDDFPAHLLAKVHDRVPSSRQITWDGPDTLAILMPDTPSCIVAQVTDMVCVEVAAHQMPDHQMITTYTYPPLSAPPGV